MLKRLNTTIYHVADLAAAKTWYAKAIGVEPYFDEPFYVGFNINGFELGLDPDMSKVQPGNHSVSYWCVDDVSASLEKFLSVGATLVQDKTNVGGALFVGSIQDPFGNEIGLIEGV